MGCKKLREIMLKKISRRYSCLLCSKDGLGAVEQVFQVLTKHIIIWALGWNRDFMMNKPDVSTSALQDRTARVLEKKTPIQEGLHCAERGKSCSSRGLRAPPSLPPLSAHFAPSAARSFQTKARRHHFGRKENKGGGQRISTQQRPNIADQSRA